MTCFNDHAAILKASCADSSLGSPGGLADLFPDIECQSRDTVGHYSSGVNTHGLIRGYADAGQPFCLPVIGMGAGIPGLVRRVSDRCMILLDSGAFGAFRSAVRQLDSEAQVPHFESADWRAAALPLATLDFAAVAESYRFIAGDHPENIALVLPDIVGFQAESLDLLRQHRAAFAWTASSPVTALLPIQRGTLPPTDYHHQAVEVLGYVPDGWGFPSREAAMSIPEIVQGVRDALAVGVNRIHFLGAGRESKRFAQILSAINTIPGVRALELTTDANTTRAYVGQGRPQTERRYEILRAAPEAWLRRELDLDLAGYVLTRWSSFLDGEVASFLSSFHACLRASGLAPKANAKLYSAENMTDYLVPLLDPETGEIDEGIDILARGLIAREFRSKFDAFATSSAAYDFFTGYPQPDRMQIVAAQPGDFLHHDLGCGVPTRRASACDRVAALS